jgi:hypothetical protein
MTRMNNPKNKCLSAHRHSIHDHIEGERRKALTIRKPKMTMMMQQQQQIVDLQPYSSSSSTSSIDHHNEGDDESMESQVDPRAVDALLAEELHLLSMGDRGTIEEEIHGIRSMEINETPDMIHDSILAFEREIDSMDDTLKFAYDESLLMTGADASGAGGNHCGYTLCEDFKLRFLRADRFDVRKAVRRYLHHLNLLLRMYGPDALRRPLRHSDLDTEQHDLMKGGHVQVRSRQKLCFSITKRKHHHMPAELT